MKINIISKKQNNLMKRNEIRFSVDHSERGGTPSRAEVCRHLASALSAKLELVFIKNMETKTGTMVTVGEANIYDTIEQAKAHGAKTHNRQKCAPQKSLRSHKLKTNKQKKRRSRFRCRKKKLKKRPKRNKME